MARHTRLHTLQSVYEIGVVPVFYNGDVSTVQNIAKACVGGGIKVLRPDIRLLSGAPSQEKRNEDI